MVGYFFEEIRVIIIGLWLGEKLYEELFVSVDSMLLM